MATGRKRSDRPLVDPDSPTPPPIPRDLHHLDRKNFCKKFREYFKSVAGKSSVMTVIAGTDHCKDWQGGGFINDIIPWSDLTKGGVGAIFQNHSKCIPNGLAVVAMDKMSINDLKLWYNTLISLEDHQEIPLVFTDRCLNKSRNGILTVAVAPQVTRGTIGRQESDDSDDDDEDDDDKDVVQRLPTWFDTRSAPSVPSAPTSATACDASATLGPSTDQSDSLVIDPHLSPCVTESAFPTGTQSGRGKKSGAPTTIPPGSPSKREPSGKKRKLKAMEAREAGDLPSVRRNRPRVQNNVENSSTQAGKPSMLTWGVQGPLERIAVESYAAKGYLKELPTSARSGFKAVVEAVHTLDQFILLDANTPTLSIPIRSEAPESVNLWARGCNSGEFVVVDTKFVQKHFTSIEGWIKSLSFKHVENLTDDEIMKELWFHPVGQGLSHVLWALRVWLRGIALHKRGVKVPSLFAATCAGIKKVVDRIRKSEML